MGWGIIASLIASSVIILGTIVGTQRYNEGKRGRIYERLDETKEQMSAKMEADYARKDICTLTHKQVEIELKEIKGQTALIPVIVGQLEILVKNGAAK